MSGVPTMSNYQSQLYNTTPNMGTNYQMESTSSSAPIVMSGVAIFFCVILFLLFIGVICYNALRSTCSRNPYWQIYIGNTRDRSIENDTFYPNGNDVYMVSSSSSNVTLNIRKSTDKVEGRMFMVDNTGNTESTYVRSNESIITDKINNGTIASGSTGTYIWTTENSIKRLY